MEETTPAGRPIVDREKTAPFLIRTFLKLGSFHRLNQFEEGPIPIADEQQIFTWKDATLREVLTTLRITAPNTAEYRHPLARYSFRAVYADSASRGRFAQKELGIVYSRDILGEPGTLGSAAPRLLEDADDESHEPSEREREERTLDELRFVPGDYLCVAVLLPKNVTVAVGPGGEIAIKGSATGAPAPAAPAGSNGWKGTGPRGDGGWGGSIAPAPGPPGVGRGGGHWRGGSDPAPPPPHRRAGRGDFSARDRDVDRRVPPPRRDSPPPRREGWGDRDRGGRGDRRPPSRSRSPPRRRNSRYD